MVRRGRRGMRQITEEDRRNILGRNAISLRPESKKSCKREFLGADHRPGDYVFTFEDGHPPHPTRPAR